MPKTVAIKWLVKVELVSKTRYTSRCTSATFFFAHVNVNEVDPSVPWMTLEGSHKTRAL